MSNYNEISGTILKTHIISLEMMFLKKTSDYLVSDTD